MIIHINENKLKSINDFHINITIDRNVSLILLNSLFNKLF